MNQKCMLLVASAIMAAPAVAEEMPKVAAKPIEPPAAVAPAIKKILAPTAYVVADDKKELATYWIRASIPSSEAEGLVSYDKVPEGTIVGVCEIKADDMTDFRDQKLPPGVYTLRLGIQPQDGNHMGVAPSLEFLCLVPAAKDASVEPMKHDALMKASKDAAGTGHPTALYLQPFAEKPTTAFPNVGTNEHSHILLNVQSKAAAGDKSVDFPIAIVIVGITSAG